MLAINVAAMRHNPTSIERFLLFSVMALVVTLLSSKTFAQASANVTGNWDGSWSWTDTPLTIYGNGDMLLTQLGSTVSGTGFSAAGTLTGVISGSSFTFTVDYGREDVYSTGNCTVNGDEMDCAGTDHYTVGGPRTWILTATRPSVRPDISTTTLHWNTVQGGVDFAYSVTGGSLNRATTAKL